MQKWSNKAGVLGVIMAIAAAVFVVTQDKPIAVDSHTISKDPMQVSIEADGVSRVREVYVISTPIAGRLERSTLEEGQAVIGGQTIVALIRPLDPPFLDKRVRSELAAAIEAARSGVVVAQAHLDSARAALDLARSEYARITRLSESRLVAQSALDKAASDVQLREAQVASARAQIRLREAELDSAEARLIQPADFATPPHGERCCIELKSPADGVVLNVITESEQAISAGAPIARVGDPSDMEIAVDLLSSDAARIQPGTTADILDWGGEASLTAVVRQVEPSAFTKVSSLGIEEQRVNVILDINNPPKALGHHYRVVVRLITWEQSEVRQIPISALFRANGSWATFVIEDSKAILKSLELGHMNESYGEIIAGLEAGDKVILYPNDQVQDGSLVAPRY